MINIHDRHYVAKGYNREVEDSDQLLAYMTHTEYTKTNKKSNAFEKRVATALTWSTPKRKYNREDGCYHPLPDDYNPDELQFEFDNLPIAGFKIVGSVSRWSTSNKLILVEDPRGFVVEIPTSNLTTLIKTTTITKGEVMEDCVWGRDGNNHILLPTSSDVYKQAKADTKLNSEKVLFAKLKAGDVVKFSVDDNMEYIFCGKAKASWVCETKESSGHTATRGLRKQETDKVLHTEVIEDTKWCFLFKAIPNETCRGLVDHWEYKLSGKAIIMREGATIPEIDESFDVMAPVRVREAIDNQCSRYNYEYTEWTTKSGRFKS